ncbi:cytochrome-c peroxidase [Gallaecimonas mangrovi]|uniref:cytochrome-c peroxidase n=1 Tax=Gallaecimonas mangrovi TaxID=2291597 RepID=UPI000E20B8D4|nr:cytochrome c peroxidase [Gallaecimonas mangrovi]
MMNVLSPYSVKRFRHVLILVSTLVVLTLIVVLLRLSPVPLEDWRKHPLDAAKLSLGINPAPVQLLIPKAKPLSAMAMLGEKLFFDKRLSGSGQLSCASCHAPSHDFGPTTATPVVQGGRLMQQQGFRAVPSLKYLYRQPLFSIGPDAPGDNDQIPTLQQQVALAKASKKAIKSANSTALSASNLVPMGGLFWDGRVDTLQQQASGPLFNPVEMAAHSDQEVAAKLASSPYRNDFTALFGRNIFDNPKLAVSEAMFALSRYQIEDRAFHPFSSQFDAWLQGKARLTRAEVRGYLAFNDPKAGNCAACHMDKVGKDGLPPLFTDYQYEALGVPRNSAIAANGDPHWHDLGLCGPFRQNMKAQTQYCGMFLTPSLRNSARRPVYFHNGLYHSLKDVLDWYVYRDIAPGRFYPKGANGKPVIYNDLPRRYLKNVDTTDAPLNRHLGDVPALTATQINDIIAFLGTLNDGYKGG